jgi:hypothetical protein
MSNQMTNAAKGMLLKGQINYAAHTMKIALMNSSFVFDRDNHHSYNDVAAYEIANANGYITTGKVITLDHIEVDNTQDFAVAKFLSVAWTATGGVLAASGAILYDDSTDTINGDDHTKAVIMWVDGNGTISAADGASITISDIAPGIK